MASLLTAGFQTVFAAASFAGAGYLFKMLDKDGYNAEMKRHDLAQEKLDRDREKFNEEEARAYDREQQLRREIEDANTDMNETNKSLDNLAEVERQYEALKARNRVEPRLSQYYKPSDDMRYYQSVAAAIPGVGAGVGAYHFL